MSALSWFFAQNTHGSDHGYHDAGIETFRENLLSSIARETIQNSLDARKSPSKPVDVRFDLIQLPVKSIPDVSSLDDAIKRSAKYWSHDPRASKFFKHASRLLSQQKVQALRVSDHNTTGLTGTDDDRRSNWYNLIRCFGASSKNAGEGGSFGIGSSAPFAASRLRTILYSTTTGHNKHRFIGVARLATHQDAGKVNVNPDGYLGVGNGRMVDVAKTIPKPFRRTGAGTTVTILGFDGGDNWADELKLSVVENFWPAIYYGNLVVTVGKTKINSNNIEEALLWAAEAHGSTGIEFLRCVTDEEGDEIDESLTHLGDVVLCLRTAETQLPKAVAMVRKPGMVVFQKAFRSVVPYCGVFFCENEVGNTILRDMEPPRHDCWSPDLPEKGQNRKVEREFITFIRDKIRALSDDDGQETSDVPDLGRFLPDQFDEHDNREKADDGELIETDADLEIPTSPIGTRPSRATSTELGDLGPEGGNGGEHDDDDESNDDSKGSDQGQNDGHHAAADVGMESRAIALDRNGATYSLFLRADDAQQHRLHLSIRVVGEETSERVPIESAKLKGKKLKINDNGLIANVTIKRNECATLEIALVQPRRVSLEVVAHEA